MPISVKDFTWDESDSHLFITVPLKGVKSSKVDIFSTEEYIKVHYPPYMFECFLYAAVNYQSSAAQIGNGAVIFRLEKETPGRWLQLQSSEADNKAHQRLLRDAAIKRSQERETIKREEKQAKKREEEKYAITEQMKLEEDERKRIENAKELEREKATKDLERWKEEQINSAKEENKKQRETTDDSKKAVDNTVKQEKESVLVTKELSKSSLVTTKNMANGVSNKQSGTTIRDIFTEEAGDAPVRKQGNIAVSFTPRVFPTAARESMAHDEEEWLKKQTERRRITQLEDDDLSEEEKNPVWLRDKGNTFFQAGDFHAAINVYSHAIRLRYNMPSLYSNRAACHLKLGNYMKCCEDASKVCKITKLPSR